jgi:hypothetical protein
MATNEPTVPSPAEPIPDDVKQAAEAAEHERIWNSPIGIGGPVPFDPAIHMPPMTEEEIAAMLAREKE